MTGTISISREIAGSLRMLEEALKRRQESVQEEDDKKWEEKEAELIKAFEEEEARIHKCFMARFKEIDRKMDRLTNNERGTLEKEKLLQTKMKEKQERAEAAQRELESENHGSKTPGSESRRKSLKRTPPKEMEKPSNVTHEKSGKGAHYKERCGYEKSVERKDKERQRRERSAEDAGQEKGHKINHVSGKKRARGGSSDGNGSKSRERESSHRKSRKSSSKREEITHSGTTTTASGRRSRDKSKRGKKDKKLGENRSSTMASTGHHSSSVVYVDEDGLEICKDVDMWRNKKAHNAHGSSSEPNNRDRERSRSRTDELEEKSRRSVDLQERPENGQRPEREKKREDRIWTKKDHEDGRGRDRKDRKWSLRRSSKINVAKHHFGAKLSIARSPARGRSQRFYARASNPDRRSTYIDTSPRYEPSSGTHGRGDHASSHRWVREKHGSGSKPSSITPSSSPLMMPTLVSAHDAAVRRRHGEGGAERSRDRDGSHGGRGKQSKGRNGRGKGEGKGKGQKGQKGWGRNNSRKGGNNDWWEAKWQNEGNEHQGNGGNHNDWSADDGDWNPNTRGDYKNHRSRSRNQGSWRYGDRHGRNERETSNHRY